MGRGILKWLGFTVAFSLFPFLVTAILFFADQGRPRFSLFLLWPHGELLVVSAGFAVDAIGDLIDMPRRHRTVKLLCGWICGATVLVESVAYAAIQLPRSAYTPREITAWSVTLFVLALASSLACKVLGELK